LHNATHHLSQEIDMIKTRQAYAAALGTLQLLFVITYLIASRPSGSTTPKCMRRSSN
jgi:hypothetical protein